MAANTLKHTQLFVLNNKWILTDLNTSDWPLHSRNQQMRLSLAVLGTDTFKSNILQSCTAYFKK